MDYGMADPDPDDLVLVRVRATAADPTHGAFGRLVFAGEVESVGRRVTAFLPGDSVYGVADAAFAEYVCARQEGIARMPPSADPEVVATAAPSGLTARQALALLAALSDAAAPRPPASAPPGYT